MLSVPGVYGASIIVPKLLFPVPWKSEDASPSLRNRWQPLIFWVFSALVKSNCQWNCKIFETFIAVIWYTVRCEQFFAISFVSPSNTSHTRPPGILNGQPNRCWDTKGILSLGRYTSHKRRKYPFGGESKEKVSSFKFMFKNFIWKFVPLSRLPYTLRRIKIPVQKGCMNFFRRMAAHCSFFIFRCL